MEGVCRIHPKIKNAFSLVYAVFAVRLMRLSAHWNLANHCLAILQQIAAVRGASNGLMGEMVEIHLKDELVSGETTPDQRAVRMAEIGHLLRAYLK
ncbi:Transcriptional repressor frmR [Citrobacter freundii]|nr:Transcriptional repressor frmR [Citrobacter freundii]